MQRLFSRRVMLGGSIGAAVIAAALIGALWTFRGQTEGPPAFQGQLAAFAPEPAPKPAPELKFTDAHGKAMNLADFKGRVVLLNLWATWCAPCVEEMPALDKLQARMGGSDFAVLALSLDRQGRNIVVPFLEKLGIRSLGTYIDTSNAAMRALSIRGLPTTILIDREGREVGRLEGAADWNSSTAEALIRHYIDATGKTS
jgi:thiol-disulfide isomerase/thioredoxin